MDTPWHYYTYIIKFSTGHYYYGRKACRCLPEEDIAYVGSPVTYAHMWKDSSFSKEIIATYATHEECMVAEYALIGDKHRTDPMCYNAHNGLNAGAKAGVFKWYHPDKTYERNSTACPGEGWIRGSRKSSILMKGVKKSEAHRQKMKDRARRDAHKMTGELNVMSRPDVKAKHLAAVTSEEYHNRMSTAILESDRWTDEKRADHAELHRKMLSDPNKNPMARKITIDGNTYGSVMEACKLLGKTRKEVLALNTEPMSERFIAFMESVKNRKRVTQSKSISTTVDGVTYESLSKAVDAIKLKYSITSYKALMYIKKQNS